MIRGRNPEMGLARTRIILFHWPSHSPRASVDISTAPPSCLWGSACTEHAGAWRVWLFGFTVFFFSPELSLLENIMSSVTVDLCFNFCSPPAGFLLLWGRFMVVLIPFFWIVIYFQPRPLVLLWPFKHLPQGLGKWASFGSCKQPWCGQSMKGKPPGSTVP